MRKPRIPSHVGARLGFRRWANPNRFHTDGNYRESQSRPRNIHYRRAISDLRRANAHVPIAQFRHARVPTEAEVDRLVLILSTLFPRAKTILAK